MDASLSQRTLYIEGQPLELWSATSPEFSCRPDDLRRYIEGDRWDLVFNALCYLTGAIEEGSA
jgi:hypothetical protein